MLIKSNTSSKTPTIMKKKPLTQKEYIKHKGQKCPYCEESLFDGASPQVEVGTVWQIVRCGNCEAEWKDIYKLSGYQKIKE